MLHYIITAIVAVLIGDDTHNKKQNKNLVTKGMVPITKNIRVTDVHGQEYEPTWPKRAEGLIKKGRAYRLAEDHICLIDPVLNHADTSQTKVSTDISEEIRMEEYTNIVENGGVLTMAYVLERIEAIRLDTAHLHETIDALKNTAMGSVSGDIAGQEKAKALGDIVRCRETTNQQLLKMYEKMYDDLKNRDNEVQNADIRQTMLTTVTNITTLCNDMDELPNILEQLSSIFDTLRHMG